METIRTPEKRAEFLSALASCGNVTEACRVANVARNSMYLWKNSEPAFAQEWEQYLAAGAELLEDEAVRRAREGYDEPVYHKGRVVGTIRKYSDTLLIFLLKGAMPKKYGDKTQVSGELKVSRIVVRDGEPVDPAEEIAFQGPVGAPKPEFEE